MTQIEEIHAFFRAIQAELYRLIPRRKREIGDLPFMMVMFDEDSRPQVCSNFKTTDTILAALRHAADYLEQAQESNATSNEQLPRPKFAPHNANPSQN